MAETRIPNLEECEQETPVTMYTKCVALADFEGQYSHDLPFKKGETITVLEPCNVIYWYLGENAAGKRGVIPINFLQALQQRPPSVLPPKPERRPALPPKPPTAPALPKRPPQGVPRVTRSAPDSNPQWSKTLPSRPRPPAPPPSLSESEVPFAIDTRPPMPVPRTAGKSRSCETLSSRAPSSDDRAAKPRPVLKQSRYLTVDEFRENSGWFKPTLEKVLMDKIQLNLQAFSQLSGGTYFFQHKWEADLKYAMCSADVHGELIQLLKNLYDKPLESLNPLETVIRCQHPDASAWSIRTWRVTNPEELGVEMAKLVIKHRTLQPFGLNVSVKFSSRKEWESFCTQYSLLRHS
eukprot:Em0015g449a